MVTKKKVTAKKPAKKAVPTFKEQFNFWLLSSNIESVSINVEQVKSLLELIAESMFDQKSNMVWLAADLLTKEIQTLNKLADEVMELHRQKNPIKK